MPTKNKAAAFLLALLLALTPVTAQSDQDAKGESGSDSSDVLERGGLGPRFRLHGFADINLFFREESPEGMEGASETAFAVGELDLYFLSTLVDNLSFLGELVFEFEDDGETLVDVERLFLKYDVADTLWVSAGRRHTPLGYWNQHFHHGLLLQPTVERPFALRFEDDDGILPVHSVGIQVGGRRFRNAWGLDYVTSVANGRAPRRDLVEASGDSNDQKAMLLKLSLSRQGKNELQFGPMVYLDEIPPDAASGRDRGLDEEIVGLHLHYRNERAEVFAEYFDVQHDEIAGGPSYDTSSYYAILVWRQWRWKPYGGYDRRKVDPLDPYYDGLDPDLTRYLAGVRWDVNAFHALKFEGRYDERTGINIAGIAIQASFTF